MLRMVTTNLGSTIQGTNVWNAVEHRRIKILAFNLLMNRGAKVAKLVSIKVL